MALEDMNAAVASEQTERKAWSAPHVIEAEIADDTNGVFTPGPAEVPRSCS